MNKPYFYQPKTENSYNWEGVMQFLYVKFINYFRINIKMYPKNKTYGLYKKIN